jgi:hypothetical protein
MKRFLKGFFTFILGVVFYPFIGGCIILDSVGFFESLKKINWVVVITYIVLGFFSYLWIVNVIIPCLYLINGYVLD